MFRRGTTELGAFIKERIQGTTGELKGDFLGRKIVIGELAVFDETDGLWSKATDPADYITSNKVDGVLFGVIADRHDYDYAREKVDIVVTGSFKNNLFEAANPTWVGAEATLVLIKNKLISE